VSACATVPPPSISVADLSQFQLAGVELRAADGIRAWPAEEQVFIKTNGVDEAAAAQIAQRPIHENAALKAHAAGALIALLQVDMRSELSGVLTGRKPVKAMVTVTRFDVPSVARRVFTDQVATMSARVALVDAAGATILESPDLSVSAPLLGGLSTLVASAVETSSGNEPGRVLVRNFAARYRAWLLQK
jgi:hypothetical protein